MPRGKSCTGQWNFHVKRYLCPECKKKGLYITSEKGWIICMYCNLCASKSQHKKHSKLTENIEKQKANSKKNENTQ